MKWALASLIGTDVCLRGRTTSGLSGSRGSRVSTF